MWKALACRYADIPNTYLSFTLFTGDYPLRNDLVIPSIYSIREESPDRCIIADISGWDMRSMEFARLGVALSIRLFDLERMDEVLNLRNNSYWNGTGMTDKGKHVQENFDWPYMGIVSAQELISFERYGKMENLLTVADTAELYGVGFMLSDFGVSYRGDWWNVFPRTRYEDEAYFAMITDVLGTVEDMGYGWCFAQWYGPYGIAFSIPAIQTSTYMQVEDFDYYIDQGMLKLFQRLNHMA